MKKSIILCLIMSGMFIACDNNKAASEPVIEPDGATNIESDECYLIQECNELGEPVEAYNCMIFEKNAGRTFDEAYASIKTDLDLLVARMVNDEKGGGNFDANQWELRLVNRQVKNSPNDQLVYTSIELYMYSFVYKAYTIVYQYWVIDSEGNIYQVAIPAD